MIALILITSIATSYEDVSPAWSPDGKRIAFSRREEETNDIWVFEVESKAITRITRYGSSHSPAWSPDGGKLICSFLGSDPGQIRTMNSDGRGEPTVFLRPGEHGLGATWVIGAPSWSPKGDKLAFMGQSSVGSGLQISIFELATKQIVPLTQSGHYNDWPSWSPDGKKIVFAGDPEGSQQIFVINADGSGREQITRGKVSSAMPCWSPKGDKIAYVSNRVGNSEVYAYDLVTKKEMRLTDVPTREMEPTWSPDGTKICVSSMDAEGNTRLFTFAPGPSPVKKLDPLF